MSIGTVILSEDKLNRASFTWTIDAFKDLADRIESPPIQLSTGAIFQVTLNPQSIHGAYQTVNLHYPPGSDLIFGFAIVKVDGTKGHTTDFHHHFTLDNQCCFASYINRTNLLKEENGYLVDGKLKLYFEVIDKNKVTDNEKHSADVHHLLNDYGSLLEDAKYSDVSFVVGGKEFAVHKAILASRSPVFDAMFSQEFREKTENKVELPDISVEVFERLLRGIYTGRLSSLEGYAEELLAATNKYQVVDLKKQATQFLIPLITTDSAISLLLLSDMHQSAELKSECINYIAANLATVKATEGWKHLEANGSKHSDLLLDLLNAVAK